MVLSDKVHKIGKFVAQIALPAVGTLYFALAGIWSLPFPEKVLGTIIAVDTFLGVILGISTNNYRNSDAAFDGAIHILEGADKKTYSLELNTPIESLDKMNRATFKVTPSQ
jgi:Putative phage holin Dp-1